LAALYSFIKSPKINEFNLIIEVVAKQSATALIFILFVIPVTLYQVQVISAGVTGFVSVLVVSVFVVPEVVLDGVPVVVSSGGKINGLLAPDELDVELVLAGATTDCNLLVDDLVQSSLGPTCKALTLPKQYVIYHLNRQSFSIS